MMFFDVVKLKLSLYRSSHSLFHSDHLIEDMKWKSSAF
jgi:hypothetical protein